MTDFAMRATGLIGGSLPWSIGFRAFGSISESAASTSFSTRVNTLFNTTTNGLKNFMSADVELTGTKTTTLNAAMKQTTVTATSLAVTGIDANPSLPWNIAEVVTLRSAFANKSGHGRIFLPPFAEDQVVAHVIKAATTASMKTVFDAFFAGLVADGLTLFVVNMKTLKDGTAAFTKKNLVTYDISDKPAQQRRRVSKVIPTRVAGII